MNYTIRRLGPSDASDYLKIRLEMLQDLPEAYGDSYEEARGHALSDVAAWLGSERAFFGAFDGHQLIGAVNFRREVPHKMKHRGWLLGLYVAPAARGTGCAMALVDQVVDHARSQVRQVHLGVGAFNLRAKRLYERAGFEVYGTEPRSLYVDGKYYDEHFMVRFLDKDVVE